MQHAITLEFLVMSLQQHHSRIQVWRRSRAFLMAGRPPSCGHTDKRLGQPRDSHTHHTEQLKLFCTKMSVNRSKSHKFYSSVGQKMVRANNNKFCGFSRFNLRECGVASATKSNGRLNTFLKKEKKLKEQTHTRRKGGGP